MSVKNLKRLFSFRALFLLLSLLLLAVQARADWINLTGAETAPNIAEIYIFDDHVKVQLEIYPDDLETFKDLIPDEWTAKMNIQRPPMEVRQSHFANPRRAKPCQPAS